VNERKKSLIKSSTSSRKRLRKVGKAEEKKWKEKDRARRRA